MWTQSDSHCRAPAVRWIKFRCFVILSPSLPMAETLQLPSPAYLPPPPSYSPEPLGLTSHPAGSPQGLGLLPIPLSAAPLDFIHPIMPHFIYLFWRMPVLKDSQSICCVAFLCTKATWFHPGSRCHFGNGCNSCKSISQFSFQKEIFGKAKQGVKCSGGGGKVWDPVGQETARRVLGWRRPREGHVWTALWPWACRLPLPCTHILFNNPLNSLNGKCSDGGY